MDELTTVIEQFLRGSIRRPIRTAAGRDSTVSFTDMQEAAAGTFLLNPRAPFYVLRLAADAVSRLVEQEIELINELVDLVDAVGRGVTPVKDLTPLGNITAALFELETAIGQRSSGFRDIQAVPSYKRFNTNVTRFLESNGHNVKEGGRLVPTPQEARSSLAESTKKWAEQRGVLVGKAGLLAQGMVNYDAVNLPALVAKNVVNRARGVLTERLQALAAAGEEERLSQLKQTVLELVGAKTVVTTFGAFAGAQTSLHPGPVVQAYSDSTHPATPPSVDSLNGPFSLENARNEVDCFISGQVPTAYLVDVATPSAFVASFSRSSGSFVVDGVGVGSVVYVRSGVDSGSRWVVYQVTASTLTAAGKVRVNPALGVSVEVYPQPDDSGVAPVGTPAALNAHVSEPFTVYQREFVEPPPPAAARVTFPATNTLRFYVNDTLYTLNLADVHPDDLDVNITPDPLQYGWGIGQDPYNRWRTPMLLQHQMQGSSPHAKLDLYFSPALIEDEFDIGGGPTNYMATKWLGVLPAGIQNTGWYVKLANGAMYRVTSYGPTFVAFQRESYMPAPTLGLQTASIGTKPKFRLVLTGTLAEMANPTTLRLDRDYPNSLSPQIGLVDGVTSKNTPVTTGTLVTGLNRSFNNVRAEVAFNRLEELVGRTSPTSPTTVTLSKAYGEMEITATTVTLPEEADIQVGDVVVFRDGTNLVCPITGVNGLVLTATGLPVAGTYLVDVGTPVTGTSLRILDTQNAGSYQVLSVSNSLDVEVTPTLVQRQDFRGDPILLQTEVGHEVVRFHSPSTEAGAQITIAGSALPVTDLARTGGGTTPWVSVEKTTGIQVGDELSIHLTDYANPSNTHTITGVEPKILKVDPEVGWVSYPVEGTVPFARVSLKRALDITALTEGINSWLASNSTTFFVNLNRLINPLVANTNPTSAQVAAAKQEIQSQLAALEALTGLLDGYVVEAVPEVDILLRSFREKGADRALDLLLSGDFASFFSVDIDSSSYAGELLKQMRELARESLPVRKTDRQGREVIATIATDDYEFRDEGVARPDPYD